MQHQGRKVIRKGDQTNHGGQLVLVSSGRIVMGLEVALSGDMTICPKCKGQFPIKADGAGAKHTGTPYTYENDVPACGAKLIASL